MKLLITNPPGSDELKCFITFAATNTKFTVGTADSKYENCGPQVIVKNDTTGLETVIFSANSTCRYIADEANALEYDNLVVDEWLEWESNTLSVWMKKAKKNNVIDEKVVESLVTILTQKETDFVKATQKQYLCNGYLTLADIIVGVALKEALDLVATAKTRYSVLETCRTYVSKLFDLEAFVNGQNFLSTGGKSESKLNVKASKGITHHNVLGLIQAIFAEAMESAFPGMDIPDVEVTKTKNPKFGDYQCNSSMSIFTSLKNTPNAMKTPRDVAQAIINNIPTNKVIDRLSIAGPGFINAFLTPQFVAARLQTILTEGAKASPVEPSRVAVDFSSPNIAKDMHVGHLRSTIIGDTMCRILEFQGHEVLRINHVGDWGTQFGMLICHLTDTYQNWEEEMPDITDLTKLYKAAKERFDNDEAFHAESKAQVVELQGGNPRSRKVWSTLCEISRKEFQKVYDRLGVSLEEKGESFYNPIIPSVIDKIKEKGLTEDSDGALVVFTKKFKQPFMLVKSDGSYLYDTTDIAALWYRLHEMKASRVIYYTDYTQNDHFSLLFEVAKMAKILDESKHRVDHVGFGTVNDETGKRFKTRSGEVVRLVDLLDEAKNRMKEQLIARIDAGQTVLPRDQVEYAAEKIGYGAVKYFDLRQSPTSNYVFSYDRMLSTSGDTAVYLMFAYARLSSIVRKSGMDVDELINKKIPIQPLHATELALANELLQFQDIIAFVTKDLGSNRLCSYLYTIAEKVQTFVTSCRVIGSDEQASRLLLCAATLKVMKQCFELLGMEPLEQI